jgi:glycosyltransferase involved in cell wall biosynthesis
MEYAKINVLIVTYNQEKVIGRNIESIIRQKDFGLNEIVIADDCSTDNNWQVIQDYISKYPGYIRAFRNNPNLGIYGNSNKLVKNRGNADLFCWLEGDDALVDGLFKDVQEQIIREQIDLSTATGLFHDYIIDAQGKEKLVSNKHILDSKKPFSLYFRGMVSWRATLFTEPVLKQFIEVETKGGVGLAESMFDSQFFMYLQSRYYSPIPGSIYYSGIGVSTQLGLESSYHTTDVIKNNNILANYWKLDGKDKKWSKYNYNKASYLIKPTAPSFFKVLYYYIMGSVGYNFSVKFLVRLSAFLLKRGSFK